MTQTRPYGMRDDGSARCINSEPGTFNHECGKRAAWIGTNGNGHRACFCDDCKERGHEARGNSFERITPTVCQAPIFGTGMQKMGAYCGVPVLPGRATCAEHSRDA
jgi:hypothetical protein